MPVDQNDVLIEIEAGPGGFKMQAEVQEKALKFIHDKRFIRLTSFSKLFEWQRQSVEVNDDKEVEGTLDESEPYFKPVSLVDILEMTKAKEQLPMTQFLGLANSSSSGIRRI